MALRLDVRTAHGDQLRAEVERVDGWTVVRLVGEVDADSAPCLRAGLVEALGDGPVLLDIACVPFLDSAGLAALVAADRAAHERGQRLVVQGANGLCERVLRVSGLHRVLTLDPALR